MSGATCDVCGKASIGVGCSSLGALSLAYCLECSTSGAEPYDLTVGMVAMLGGSLEALAEWFHPMLFATVLRVNKTAEEFWSDVETQTARQAKELDALAKRDPVSP